MSRVGFEPAIPVFQRLKTVHALDRAATVIDTMIYSSYFSCSSLTLSYRQPSPYKIIRPSLEMNIVLAIWHLYAHFSFTIPMNLKFGPAIHYQFVFWIGNKQHCIYNLQWEQITNSVKRNKVVALMGLLHMNFPENNQWDTFSSSKSLKYLSRPKWDNDRHFAKHGISVAANKRPRIRPRI
jgi:hypothetical protein